MIKPELLYFDIRGRADPIRMILNFVGVEFEDKQITLAQWESLQSTTPFRRMPVYREENLEIPESFAILNYLGRKHGLLGLTESDRIRCDIAIESWRDYGNRVANVFGALSTSQEARKHFVSEEQPALIEDLEAFYLQKNDTSEIWIGNSPTICDFTAFHLLDGFAKQFPGSLAKFPALETFRNFFADQPKIRAYLDSPERPAALFYGPNGKIYPQE